MCMCSTYTMSFLSMLCKKFPGPFSDEVLIFLKENVFILPHTTAPNRVEKGFNSVLWRIQGGRVSLASKSLILVFF